MANPNDNSELFEIFQNQVDLEEEQEKEKKENKESGGQEDDEKEEEEEETEKKSSEQKEQAKERPSSEPDQSRSQDQPDTSSPDRSAAREQTSSPNDQASQSPPPPKQPETPSSTVSPEDDKDPDTETGSFIKELEEEKELEGKIILSRGASVFLLILAVVFIIGSYFFGRHSVSNQGAIPTSSTASENDGEKNLVDGETNTDNSVPTSSNEGGSTSNSNSNTGGSSDGESGIVQNKTYYTFAIIAFSSRGDELEKNLNILRNQTEINHSQINIIHNLRGNGNYWIVVGRLNSRDKAKELQDKIRAQLDRTENAGSYRADIVDLTTEQARQIAN